MGDRANVYLPRARRVDGADAEEGVYLYTHGGGCSLPIDVRDALIRCAPDAVRERVGKPRDHREVHTDDRWTDAAYLNRVIFCWMVGERRWKGTTGYGISTRIEDNEHPIIRVDVATQTVSWDGETSGSWSFQDFCGLTDEQIELAWLGPSDE